MIIPRTSAPKWRGWTWLKDYFVCPLKFKYRRVDKIEPMSLDGRKEGLDLGQALHALVAQWEHDRLTDEKDYQSILATFVEIPDTTKTKALGIFSNYCKHWSMRPTDGPYEVEVEVGPVIIAGQEMGGFFDGIKVTPYGHVIVENKFEARPLGDSFKEHAGSGQTIYYGLIDRLAKLPEKYGPLVGVELNLTDTRGRCAFLKETVEIPEHALRPGGWVESAVNNAIRGAHAIENGAFAEGNPNSCTAGRFSCEFASLCRFGAREAGRYVFKSTGGSLAQGGPGKAPWD